MRAYRPDHSRSPAAQAGCRVLLLEPSTFEAAGPHRPSRIQLLPRKRCRSCGFSSYPRTCEAPSRPDQVHKLLLPAASHRDFQCHYRSCRGWQSLCHQVEERLLWYQGVSAEIGPCFAVVAMIVVVVGAVTANGMGIVQVAAAAIVVRVRFGPAIAAVAVAV